MELKLGKHVFIKAALPKEDLTSDISDVVSLISYFCLVMMEVIGTVARFQ